MAYFPVFIDLTDKKILVVGGGPVALRKIRTLMGFGPEITVIAKSFAEEFSGLSGIKMEERVFCDYDIEGFDMVIAATDDQKLNRRIDRLCGEKKILVNTASGRGENSFYFPAIAANEEFTIGITTSGSNPSRSKAMRKHIEKAILNGDFK